jgi:hypothetical protein
VDVTFIDVGGLSKETIIIIICSVVGGVAVIGAIIGIVCYCKRRKSPLEDQQPPSLLQA